MAETNSPPVSAPVLDVSRGKAYTVLAILLLLNVFNYMDRSVINVALEAIKHDFSLTDTQVGFLQSLFFIGVGVMILPTGILIDRWSRKSAVAIMAILWSAATVLTGTASGFISLLFARFWCGSGEAGFQPGGTAWLSVVFAPKHRSKVTGIFLSGGILGSMLGMAVGGYLISRTGTWRTPFLIFGVVGIVLGFLAFLMPDARVKFTGTRPSLMGELKELFKNKTYFNTCFAQGLFMARSMAMTGWSVVIMIRAYDLSALEVGTYLAITAIPSIFAPALGGFAADMLNKWNPFIGRPLFTMIGCALTFVLSCVQFALVGHVSLHAYIGLAIACGFATAMYPVTWQVIAMDVLHVDQRGKGAAMVGLVSFLLFSWWGATLVGAISDALGSGLEGLRWAILIVQPFTLIAFYFCYRAFRSYRYDRLGE